MPIPSFLPKIINAFHQAPLNNPDGQTGINLHFDFGASEAIPEVDTIYFSTKPNHHHSFDTVKRQYFGDTQDRSEPTGFKLDAERLVFRYCIFGHNYEYTTYSGVSELPGNDFMVTLRAGENLATRILRGMDFYDVVLERGAKYGGTFNDSWADMQAGIFMHELGHTLGLRHGGFEDENFKPNYLSVMNYSFHTDRGGVDAFTGLPRLTNRPLDYSRYFLDTLNEVNLNEALGIQGPIGRYTRYGVNGEPFVAPTSGTLIGMEVMETWKQVSVQILTILRST